MYFNKLLPVPFYVYSLEQVAAHRLQFDFDCIQSSCSSELHECTQDGGDASLAEVKRSYCRTIASCMRQDVIEGHDPMSCLDGIDAPMMSAVEVKMQQCMEKNRCVSTASRPAAKTTIPELGISTVQQGCLQHSCSAELTSCTNDSVCKALFECLELHGEDGQAGKCSVHLTRVDGTERSALQCGWNNKCFTGSYKPSALTQTAGTPTPLNTVATQAPTITPLSKEVPVKSSFLQIKPLSFLSLQTATEAELQAAEAQAEKQAKEAEIAWEQSRKNTDSLLAKVHGEIDTLNADLDKTSAQEKADLALLEDNRKKEDAELEATEKKLKELANTKVKMPSSSFLEGFNTDDFLAPLRRAAQQARSFAQQLKDHSFFKTKGSSFIENAESDKANKALSLAQQALKKLDLDIAAQKKELAEEEAKAKKEQEEAEAKAAIEFAPPARPLSFLQLGSQLMSMSTADLKAAEAKAAKEAKAAEAAWEASKQKTDSLLAKVHSEIEHLNSDLEKSSAKDRTQIALLEQQRKEEDVKLAATSNKIKALESSKGSSSFVETGSEDFLAPLRKAVEEAKSFAAQLKSHPFGGAASFLELSDNDKATQALSLAEKALKKLDADIAAEKKELAEAQAEAKRDNVQLDNLDAPSSFLETKARFDPLSPQALADWRDRFELQLQKAREAAGIHTPMHSSLAQLSLSPSFFENEQLKEDERLVERLEGQYNQQMQKLKEDNAELLARAKDEMEKAKEEQARIKNQLAQSSFLQTAHKYDPAEEEAKIRSLERKWVKEAQAIVTPPQVSQQDNELQALIEQQRVKEAESEAQLDQMKAKLSKDIEIMNKDLAANTLQLQKSRGGVSFLETGAKGGPAEAALQRAENDLQKLKQQLREETAKLNAMHFDVATV